MNSRTSPYELGLDKNEANFVALSPLSFIERSASGLPGSHRGDLRLVAARPGATTYARCRRLASALAQRGVGVGDTVAVMLPNVPAMFEAHFGVPMTGAVLNTLNTRLDAEAIAFMLQHGEAKVLLTDREFAAVVGKALAMVGDAATVGDRSRGRRAHRPASRLGDDRLRGASGASGDPNFAWQLPADEWDAIASELHLGHDGQPQGRGHPPPRRVPERGVNVVTWEHAASLGLPVDAADVPLQRLVLPVDDGAGRRHQRLSASRRSEGRSSR